MQTRTPETATRLPSRERHDQELPALPGICRAEKIPPISAMRLALQELVCRRERDTLDVLRRIDVSLLSGFIGSFGSGGQEVHKKHRRVRQMKSLCPPVLIQLLRA